MDFRVDLDDFRGPLDLLLYLIRKQELDVIDIRIAAVTEQFLEHIAVLEQIDVDRVGDFLDVASQLIEMKSLAASCPARKKSPRKLRDPRQDLVRRLLEYKQYRDAASVLEELLASGENASRVPRTTCQRGRCRPRLSRFRKLSFGT